MQINILPVVMISNMVDRSIPAVELDFSECFVEWPAVQLQLELGPEQMSSPAVDSELTVVRRPVCCSPD